MFVVYVQTGRELEVTAALRKKDFTAYAPRRIVRYRKGGVNYCVPEILFDGYVFVDLPVIDSYDYYAIRAVPGVGNFISRSCPISSAEEEYILKLCNNGADIDISKGYIENGVLKIKSGFLKHLEHKIVRYSKRQHRATVEVNVHGVPHRVVCGIDIE